MEKPFPFTYLGCPIYIGKKKICYFDDMLTKIVKRLNGWQGKMLTYGGKVVLIKSVLQARPTYTLTTINPPKGTINLIQKHFVRFFWGSNGDRSKYHWRFWDKLCSPKEEEGIGIRNMHDLSNTLAIKRWWRYRTQPSLWADFMNSKYCIRTHTVAKKWCSGNSQAWKYLVNAREKAEPNIIWRINEGECSIWWDNWTGKWDLAAMFPDDIINPRAKVKDYIADGMWDLQRLRNMFPEHMVQHINSIHIGQPDEKDYAFWKLTQDGNFDNYTAWNLVRQTKAKNMEVNQVWHQCIPFKISFLT